MLGSASPELLSNGRRRSRADIGYVDIAGFDLGEVGAAAQRRLWVARRFSASFLAGGDAASNQWRARSIRTLPRARRAAAGYPRAGAGRRRLWMMLAHYHGQAANASEIARSLGEAHTTVKRHLDALTGALVVDNSAVVREPRQAPGQGAKGLRAPDSGLLHALLGADSADVLDAHPKVGASWEGIVIEELIGLAGERDCVLLAHPGRSGARPRRFSCAGNASACR